MTDVLRVSPAEAHAKMKDEAFTYVDVRTDEEVEAGHPIAGWDGTKGTFGEVIDPGWSRVSLPTGTGQPEGRSYVDLRKRS